MGMFAVHVLPAVHATVTVPVKGGGAGTGQVMHWLTLHAIVWFPVQLEVNDTVMFPVTVAIFYWLVFTLIMTEVQHPVGVQTAVSATHLLITLK